MWKWLRYSGFSVTITANPCHWAWWPRTFQQHDAVWDFAHVWSVSWLCLNIRVWADDGSW